MPSQHETPANRVQGERTNERKKAKAGGSNRIHVLRFGAKNEETMRAVVTATATAVVPAKLLPQLTVQQYICFVHQKAQTYPQPSDGNSSATRDPPLITPPLSHHPWRRAYSNRSGLAGRSFRLCRVVLWKPPDLQHVLQRMQGEMPHLFDAMRADCQKTATAATS